MVVLSTCVGTHGAFSEKRISIFYHIDTAPIKCLREQACIACGSANNILTGIFYNIEKGLFCVNGNLDLHLLRLT